MGALTRITHLPRTFCCALPARRSRIYKTFTAHTSIARGGSARFLQTGTALVNTLSEIPSCDGLMRPLQAEPDQRVETRRVRLEHRVRTDGTHEGQTNTKFISYGPPCGSHLRCRCRVGSLRKGGATPQLRREGSSMLEGAQH